jgi:hypothetical protein
MTDDSEYRQTIGLLALTNTLLFTNNYLSRPFIFVERVSLWNAFIRVTHLSLLNAFIYLWNVFFWNALLLFLWNAFLCGTSLFVEHCYKVTTAIYEVESIDKVGKEKVEDESKLALVEERAVKEITAREEVGSNEKFDDKEDVEEEPVMVSLHRAKPQ